MRDIFKSLILEAVHRSLKMFLVAIRFFFKYLFADNVHFQHSARLMKLLNEKGIQYDSLVSTNWYLYTFYNSLEMIDNSWERKWVEIEKLAKIERMKWNWELISTFQNMNFWEFSQRRGISGQSFR